MTNKERFIELLRSTKREGIEKLIDFLEKTDFFTAPASTRFHMSCEGGLLQHSLNVYDCLAGLGTTTGDVQEFQAAGMRLDSIPQESIIIVALLHDLCKVNFYATEMRWRKDANNKWEQYPVYAVNDRNPYGHGEKCGRRLQLPKEGKRGNHCRRRCLLGQHKRSDHRNSRVQHPRRLRYRRRSRSGRGRIN